MIDFIQESKRKKFSKNERFSRSFLNAISMFRLILIGLKLILKYNRNKYNKLKNNINTYLFVVFFFLLLVRNLNSRAPLFT